MRRQRGAIPLGLLAGLIPGGASLYFILGVAALVALFFARLHWIQEGREQILRENVQVAVRILTRIEETVREVEKVRTKREIEIQHVWHTIEKEVIREVPVRADCNVTRGWMLAHDYAAEGQDRPKPGGLDDRADTGIDEARALGVVAENYIRYHHLAKNLQACRAAVKGVQQAISGER